MDEKDRAHAVRFFARRRGRVRRSRARVVTIRNFFANPTANKPEFTRNQFGASAAGRSSQKTNYSHF